MSITRNLWKPTLALLGACLLLGSAAPKAEAGTVTPVTVDNTKPRNLPALFQKLYDKDGTRTGSIDTTLTLSNGVKFVRVDDFISGSSNLDLSSGAGGGTSDDRNWKDGVVNIIVKAKVAWHTHQFGWSGSSTPLIDYSVNKTAGPLTLSSDFEWWFYDKNTSTKFWSDHTGHTQDFDHMVTWELFDGSGAKKWILAWEDLTLAQNSDTDYNDMVLELTVASAPLPTALGPGLVGLVAVGLVCFERRRRRQLG